MVHFCIRIHHSGKMILFKFGSMHKPEGVSVKVA
nr:MAG TPA: hypothetical protein [Caudoviricetes sp.]